MTNAVETATHPFAHIMPGPYSLASIIEADEQMSIQSERAGNGRFYTSQPGGTCACCGLSIIILVQVKGAEGIFSVGTDCIKKIDWTPKAKAIVNKAINEFKTKKRKAKTATQFELACQWVTENDWLLGAIAHPKGWANKSLLEYLEWYRVNAGKAKFVQVVKQYGFAA